MGCSNSLMQMVAMQDEEGVMKTGNVLLIILSVNLLVFGYVQVNTNSSPHPSTSEPSPESIEVSEHGSSPVAHKLALSDSSFHLEAVSNDTDSSAAADTECITSQTESRQGALSLPGRLLRGVLGRRRHILWAMAAAGGAAVIAARSRGRR